MMDRHELMNAVNRASAIQVKVIMNRDDYAWFTVSAGEMYDYAGNMKPGEKVSAFMDGSLLLVG